MRTALMFLLAAAAAGCSAESDPSASSADSTPGNAVSAAAGGVAKACDVLTQADAAKALGRPVEKLENDGGPAGLDICQYGYQGERIADMGNVSVTVQPLDLASVKAGAEAQGYKFESVPGLGDAALYSADVGLYVGKGDRTAIYLLAANGMTDPKGKVIELARTTVERL